MRGRRKLLGVFLSGVVALAVLGPALPASAVATFEAELNGSNEVPGPGDPDGSGAARIAVNVKRQRICYSVTVVDINLPSAGAHIHKGAVGVAGPVRVTLKQVTEVGTGGYGVSFGCEKDLRKGLLRRIRSNPQNFYVNVHNVAFAEGAVRGQLG